MPATKPLGWLVAIEAGWHNSLFNRQGPLMLFDDAIYPGTGAQEIADFAARAVLPRQ